MAYLLAKCYVALYKAELGTESGDYSRWIAQHKEEFPNSQEVF